MQSLPQNKLTFNSIALTIITIAGTIIFKHIHNGLEQPRTILRKTWKQISSIKGRDGGADRDRTDDLKLAKLLLSQLSYSPD